MTVVNGLDKNILDKYASQRFLFERVGLIGADMPALCDYLKFDAVGLRQYHKYTKGDTKPNERRWLSLAESLDKYFNDFAQGFVAGFEKRGYVHYLVFYLNLDQIKSSFDDFDWNLNIYNQFLQRIIITGRQNGLVFEPIYYDEMESYSSDVTYIVMPGKRLIELV